MKATLTYLNVLFFFSTVFGQQPLDIYHKKLNYAKHDTTRMVCYQEIADLQNRGDSMLYYVQKGLNISKKYPNHIVNAKLFNSLGRAYEIMGKPDSAIYYFDKAYELSLKLMDDKQIKYAHFNRILLYQSPAQQISELLLMLRKYNYNTTIRSYDKALLFTLYGVIAKNYIHLENMDKGRFYLQKSRKFISTYRDSVFYNIRYSLLLSLEAEQYSKARNVSLTNKVATDYKQLLVGVEKIVATKHDDLAKLLTSVTYGNYANILTFEKKHKESIYFINKAVSSYGINKLPENLVYTTYESLGKNYIGLGQLHKGLFYLRKAYTYYENSQFNSAKSSILKAMSEAYFKLGNYGKAYEYLEKASKNDDDYYGKKQQQLSLEVDKQFELAEKREQIATQELTNKLKEERIRVETQQKNILIGLLVLSLGLLAWALWSYIKQRQLRQLLEHQAQELLDANETKDKIFALLGHDLQSPISDLKTVIMLFQSEDMTFSEVQDLIVSLTVKIESLQAMMNNVLQWSLLELKHQNTNHQVIELKLLIERVIQQLQPNVDKKKIKISAQQQDVQIVGNTDEVEIIIRNLLSNAIKFTPINGHIDIETAEKYQKVEVIIKDTGIGVPVEIEHNTVAYPTSKMGTAKEKGIGLGLRIVRDLTTKNGGLFSIHRNNTSGTTVSLIFQN